MHTRTVLQRFALTLELRFKYTLHLHCAQFPSLLLLLLLLFFGSFFIHFDASLKFAFFPQCCKCEMLQAKVICGEKLNRILTAYMHTIQYFQLMEGLRRR